MPSGKKAVGCKWVYKIKYHSDGTMERYKTLLVILGNHQVEGIDYTETFAPVAKMVTVRTFLVFAASQNWEVHQMDVHNTFLHGDLQEEVHMKLNGKKVYMERRCSVVNGFIKSSITPMA